MNLNTIKELITFGSVIVTGAVVSKEYERPPAFSGIFIGIGFLIKKMITSNTTDPIMPSYKQNLIENLADITLPYGYYYTAKALRHKYDFILRYDLDFCLPGTLHAYNTAQMVAHLAEPATKHSPSLLADLSYVATAAVSGAIFGARFSTLSIKQRCAYAAIMATRALINRAAERLISYIEQIPWKNSENLLIKDIITNVYIISIRAMSWQLTVDALILLEERFIRPYEDGRVNCYKAETTNTLFWSSLNYLRSSKTFINFCLPSSDL